MTKTALLAASGLLAALVLTGCATAPIPSPGETVAPSPAQTTEPAGATDDALLDALDAQKAAMAEWDAGWFAAGCPAYDAGDTASADCRALLPAAIDVATATDELFGDLDTSVPELVHLDPLRAAAEYAQWRGGEWYAAGCDAVPADDASCAWPTWDLVDDLGVLQEAFTEWTR
ncbi:MAG TPA: hypothetical protein VN200_01965 [Rhodoglobus sp.]|nr:hypothetical protein [Rhodoglobus sp.]